MESDQFRMTVIIRNYRSWCEQTLIVIDMTNIKGILS